ncbi:MAG TPA: J domain-containing protein [Thermomicrobiales bacterium]|nr:J domain-containing protein [Thermomicrobiales bacterium]
MRSRVERLRAEVTGVGAELEQVRATLSAFEARYEARVGVLIVELDRVNLEIAKTSRKVEALNAGVHTWERVNQVVEHEFAAEQRRVEQERREASGAGRRASSLPDPPSPDVARAIKDQYRRLARRFHPDVAITDDQRAHNETAMKRINEAMAANDLDMLGMLEASLPRRGPDMPSGSSRARVQWATAETARLEQALTRAIGRLAAIKASSVYELWSRVERDPGILDRLAAEISGEVAVARMQLRAVTGDLERLITSRAAHDEQRAGD